MTVSQNSDKAVPTSAPGGAPAGQVPAPYARQHSAYQWQVPAQFNIAQVCCRRWAERGDATKRVAIHAYSADAAGVAYTYAALLERANKLSNALHALGVQRGDRVGIVMPQCFDTAVAYMAVLQMGAVAMPLSLLFGPEALEYRLRDSEAVLAICDASALADMQATRATCTALRCVLGVGAAATLGLCDQRLDDALAQQPGDFAPVATASDDPAVLIYTSGTTGNPKGALIAHRGLIGNLPGFVASQNWFGFGLEQPLTSLCAQTQAAQADIHSVFWSPADWAWTGGLMDALLPTLYYGRRIVAYNGRFSAQTALELMGQCGVTHTFLFPTALKAMMKAYPGTPECSVRQQFGLQLQALMSAGEAVGDAVFGYCVQQLGVQPNEMFGQTEINYIVGNCVAHWGAKPGSMGMGYPGHNVQLIDEAGQPCSVGVPGDVALNRYDVHGRPDPVFFLGYWKNDTATQTKFTGDWCRTGDLAVRDADGYLWYQGRSDDVFKSAGYRIGPGEIENCLVKHPAVANVAVVPKPDRERGALVKAYVVIAPNYLANYSEHTGPGSAFQARLQRELQDHVKGQLAPYEYPKEIEFVDALPMTTTGKVQRRVLRLQEEERWRAQEAAQ
ncbi:MAG: AMP-binding protein [Burkholderiales bacterium]